MNKQEKVIIRKINNVPMHGAHHGGMWKVAYADFVTAMMAFFILLWVLNSVPQETLQGIAKYFTPIQDKNTHGLMDENSSFGSSRSTQGFEPNAGGMLSEEEKQNFINIMNTIQKSAEASDYADHLIMDITNEGLRIQIMDDDRRPMFRPGTDYLEGYMEKVLLDISSIVNKVSNYISIVGHTASIRNPSSSNVNLWDLSIKRSEKVREFLENRGGVSRVAKIVGQADKDPLDPVNPYAVHNIRIGIILMHNALLNNSQKAIPETIFNSGRAKR